MAVWRRAGKVLSGSVLGLVAGALRWRPRGMWPDRPGAFLRLEGVARKGAPAARGRGARKCDSGPRRRRADRR
eukprot:2681061-Alexandrium_andersonii.AAC.1